MTTNTIPRGCNFPCISYTPDNEDLFGKKVVANEDGTLTVGDIDSDIRDVSDFSHGVFVPTWTGRDANGEPKIGFLNLPKGHTATVVATAPNELTVDTDTFSKVFTDKVLVIFHSDLSGAAVLKYYGKGSK